MSATFLPVRGNAAHVGGGERELNLVGRDLLGQSMDGVELLDRLLVGVGVALRRQVTLPDVDDEEGGIEPTLDHLGQVDLRRQVLRVVACRREVVGVDVVVRVESNHPLMNRARPLLELGIGRRLPMQAGRRRENDDGSGQGDASDRS